MAGGAPITVGPKAVDVVHALSGGLPRLVNLLCERALQEAGVKTDSGSLSFNLRGQGQQQEQQANGNAGNGRPSGDPRPQSAETLPAQTQAYRSSHSGSLDIRV